MSLEGQSGFTLPELMVALALSALTLVGAYQVLSYQQRIYLQQNRTVQVQQNLRATLHRMVEEIRMAGYDPQTTGTFGFTHLPATGDPDYGRATAADAIYFTLDANGNGTLDPSDLEQVGFRLNVAQDGSPLDGSPGKETDHVLRKYSCGAVKWQPLAQDIETLQFVYFDPAGTIISEADLPGRLSDIRTIQIVLIGRAPKQERNYTNRTVYRDPQGHIVFTAPGDSIRRRMLTAAVTCRNRIQP